MILTKKDESLWSFPMFSLILSILSPRSPACSMWQSVIKCSKFVWLAYGWIHQIPIDEFQQERHRNTISTIRRIKFSCFTFEDKTMTQSSEKRVSENSFSFISFFGFCTSPVVIFMMIQRKWILPLVMKTALQLKQHWQLLFHYG